MSTSLGRRLKKLETIVTGPDHERQRRVAEGTCLDCGCEHGYLPTNGGAWHCVVCGRPFTLRPGPACLQTCPIEGGRGCRARQILRPPDPGHRAWFEDRWTRRAVADLRRSMADEHLAIVQEWLSKHHVEGEPLGRPGENVYAVFGRLRPTALVRAALILVGHHVDTQLSVSLAPAVAEVYLADPEVWPARACEGCGYLMPARARLQPDDTYAYLGGWYAGSCPVCGLDNHPEGEEDA